MNRVVVAIGCFVGIVLLLNGCCGLNRTCMPCGYEPCGAAIPGSCDACGSGCGETYWDEWVSDPPDCCDPCDNCGSWIGPQCCGMGAPCGGTSLFCNLFSPCAGLWGGRLGDSCGGDCPEMYDAGVEVFDDGAIIGSDSDEIFVEPEGDQAISPQQPTPAKRSEARLQRTPSRQTTMRNMPTRRLVGSTRTATRVIPRQTTQSAGW